MSPDTRRARPALDRDASAIGRIYVQSWRVTYTGLLPADYLDRLDLSDYAGRWRRILAALTSKQTVLLAEDQGDPVGFAFGGPEREQDLVYSGEIYAIYLLRQAQGQGWGRILMAGIASHLAEQGMAALLVWVLKENAAARGFYEHLGGTYIRDHIVTFDGISAPEVAYGWPDARALARERP